ncbi:MAG: hypothetical protein ABJA80_17590 [bacterium]
MPHSSSSCGARTASARRFALAALALLVLPTSLAAQAKEKKHAAAVPPLFAAEAPLAVTFRANFGRLRGDRTGTAPWRAATMSYAGADGHVVTVPLRVKTHGIWRLKHCELPPLRLNFSNKEAKGTLLYDLQKPKMVSVCRDENNYERLVLKEMQLYRIYQVLTPQSHRVRTLRVSYTDSASGKVEATRYAFVIEDPDELADRFGGTMTKTKGATADDIDAEPLALAYLFEYFIGNLDFSFNGLHNTELVVKPDGSLAIPVAYDFDFSGAVNAPYATVDPQFRSRRVVDRVFRGYCAIAPAYPSALARFQEKKDAIYALYHDELGALLTPDVARESLSYFDDFYADVKTPKDAQDNVFGHCVGPR